MSDFEKGAPGQDYHFRLSENLDAEAPNISATNLLTNESGIEIIEHPEKWRAGEVVYRIVTMNKLYNKLGIAGQMSTKRAKRLAAHIIKKNRNQ